MQYDVDTLDLLHLSTTRGEHAAFCWTRLVADMHRGVCGDLSTKKKQTRKGKDKDNEGNIQRREEITCTFSHFFLSPIV